MWTDVAIVSFMPQVEFRKSSIAQLRPPRHAITDGSPDPVPITVKLPGRPDPDLLTLHVDRASARRFAIHRWLRLAVGLLALAMTLTAGILYGRAHPLMVDDVVRRSLLVVAFSWFIGYGYAAYLTPKTYPYTRGPFVRMRDVDEFAAREWQAANDPGVIDIKPNSVGDLLLKHVPPLVLAIAVAALVLLA
jgi:hypothetical protein